MSVSKVASQSNGENQNAESNESMLPILLKFTDGSVLHTSVMCNKNSFQVEKC